AGAAGAAAGQAGAAGAAAGQAGSAGAAAGQAGSAGAAAGQAGSAGAAAGQAGAGATGLCGGGVCSDCAAPADDQACRTAYPGADLCAGGSCEACDKPGATLVVDPVNGSDARGSGAATAGGVAAPGCALRTVTAAIKLVNAGPGGVTTIQIVGPSTLDAGESYPLVLPADVVLTTTGDVTAKPGPSLSGSNSAVVRLQHPGSAIDTDATFVIDASGSPASSQLAGVVVEPGSTDSTRLRGVSVLDAPGNGIRLTGKARLTVQDGVTVSGAGRGGNFSGIFLTDGGSLLTIDVPAGERPTTVVGSGSSGITVTGPSGVKISGVPGANPGEGTVVLSGNTVHGFNGLATGNGQQGVSLDGLVTFNNGDASSKGGSGVFLSMNTRAKVRRCVSLGNTRAGVHVDGTGALNSPATSLVDLGVAGDPGLNVLQDAASANQGVGICFTPPTSVVTSTQVARGNTFGAAKDCATTAASLSKGANCDGPHDVSVVSASASVTLDVAMCTIP
ncbi:MAG: right-handed parallel beta-helix repeat-containing protein, partial [Polyangiaceae bacterium]|nr:right-handed parallel beta-helix repeat-containing protein [Polyangiaceae bacterium]